MLQRENTIELLRNKLRESQADIKLARMENDAIVRQFDVERKQNKYMSSAETPSARKQLPVKNFETSNRKADVDQSYLDMSYSPSFIQSVKKTERAVEQHVEPEPVPSPTYNFD